MKITSLEIRDFCVIHRATVQMDDQGLVLISGVNNDSDAADSNGSGKTTIFKALTWCFFGTTIDGEKAAGVVRKGADEAEVIANLVDDSDQEWVITRARAKSEKLSIDGPAGSVAESKDALQTQIEKLIGLDFHAFRNTVLYGQEDSSRFSDPRTTDAQRKDVLHRILRTSLLKKCEGWTRAKLKELVKAAEPLREKVANAQAAMGEWDVVDLRSKEGAWAKEHQGQVEEAERRLLAKNDWKRSHEAEIEVFPKRIAVATKTLEKLGEPSKNRKQLVSIHKKAASQLEKARTAIAIAEAEEKRLIKELAQLEGDECPVCSSDLTSPAPAAHIDSKMEALEDVRGRLRGLVAIQVKCDKQRSKAEKLIEDCDEEIDRYTAATADLEKWKRKLVEAEAKLEGVDEVLASLNESHEKLKAEINPYTEMREQAESRVRKLKAKLDKLNKVLVLKENEIAHYQFWARGFGQQGLPSFVLDSVMPLLTERTNHYLETLADGDITMEFSTRTTLKSGDERDKINISCVIEGSEDTTPSTGQRRKMEVATDLALMDLAETREGGNLDLLLLDEVLDGLDASGRARIIDLLHELRARRRSIFVVSHDPLMAEVFERVITVVKSEKMSTLEVL